MIELISSFVHSFSTVAILYNYCSVCSHYLRWWLLLLSGGEYMY
jgi:hypothetical protein